MDLDPNSSPATQPTETPAPTPVRAPPQTPILPPTASTSGAKAKAKPSKFKPKNVRSNAAELKEIEKKEQARVAALNASNARQLGRGNLLRSRGRGDAMGRGRMTTSGGADGVFGIAPMSGQYSSHFLINDFLISILEKKPGFPEPSRAYRESGGAGVKRSTSGIKKEGAILGGGGSGMDSAENQDPNQPIYPDEDEDTQRVDIEKINLVSEDDEEDPFVAGSRNNKGKGKAKSSRGLKPVRIDRHEHKDRVSQVNTTTTLKVEPGEEGTDSDTVMIDEGRSAKPFDGGQSDGVRIKQEPNDSMDISEPVLTRITPASENRGTANDASAENIAAGGKAEPSSPPLSRKIKPRRSSKKDQKPVIQTDEDRAEFNRHVEDVAILAEELGGMQTATQSQGKDAEGNVTMSGQPDADKKSGRLYLFQFPPVLPKLYDPLTQEKPLTLKATEVKKEGDGDVEITGSKTKSTIDLTKDKKNSAKHEPEEIIIKKEDAEVKDSKKEREKYVDREGWIGKMVVRKSGRVELIWGGTRMLIGRGIPASFLSMGVVVDHPDAGKSAWEKETEALNIAKKEENEGGFGGFGGGRKPEVEGQAAGMGQIMGKFVVTPDWENMM